jgi:hypothetical protein
VLRWVVQGIYGGCTGSYGGCTGVVRGLYGGCTGVVRGLYGLVVTRASYARVTRVLRGQCHMHMH